jgi:hypothetical protein
MSALIIDAAKVLRIAQTAAARLVRTLRAQIDYRPEEHYMRGGRTRGQPGRTA